MREGSQYRRPRSGLSDYDGNQFLAHESGPAQLSALMYEVWNRRSRRQDRFALPPLHVRSYAGSPPSRIAYRIV